MNFTYGKWAQGYQEMVKLYTSDEARKLFDQGKEINVVFGPIEKPNGYLTVRMSDDYVCWHMLDLRLREWRYVSFGFFPDHPGPRRLFAGQYDLSRYVDDNAPDGSGAVEHWLWKCNPGGGVQVRYQSAEPCSLSVGELKGCDVSDHWAEFPVFGEWEPFVRERTLAMPDLPHDAKKWAELKPELEAAEREGAEFRKAVTRAERQERLARKAKDAKPDTNTKK